MPIRSHLHDEKFDPETIRVLGLAYEMALVALRLIDRGDIANDAIARRIIEHAKTGERNPAHLCDAVLKHWNISVPSRDP